MPRELPIVRSQIRGSRDEKERRALSARYDDLLPSHARMSADCHRCEDARRRGRLVNDFDAGGTYQLAHHRHRRAQDTLNDPLLRRSRRRSRRRDRVNCKNR